MKEFFTNIPLTVWVAFLLPLIGAIFVLGQWKGKVDSDRASFKEFMKEVRNDIKEMLRRLPSHTLAGGSPLQLTNLGRSISERLGAAALAQDMAPLLQAQIKEKKPYEIQEKCFDYVRHEYEPPDEVESLIKTCAYDHGIDLGQVLDVLAVELRDKLLAMRTPGESAEGPFRAPCPAAGESRPHKGLH